MRVLSVIFVLGVTQSDYITMAEILIFIPIIGAYYWFYLYDAREMDKTFTRWIFRFNAVRIPYVKQTKHVKVKFRMNNRELGELLPLRALRHFMWVV